MVATAFVLIVATAFAAWGLIKVGIWLGGTKASKSIAEGFVQTLDLKPDSEEVKEINLRLKANRPWHPILDDDYFAIGKSLADAGFSRGMEFQDWFSGPKPEESVVTMNRDELFNIAWLADYGLRAWTSLSSNNIRINERLPRERAEKLSGLLDKFEIKVAGFLSETEEERERRFSSYEDRMKRMWENYG